jgi:hypothetical protein
MQTRLLVLVKLADSGHWSPCSIMGAVPTLWVPAQKKSLKREVKALNSEANGEAIYRLAKVTFRD